MTLTGKIRRRNNNNLNNRNAKRTKLSVRIPRLDKNLVLKIFEMARERRLENQRRRNNMRNRVQNYRRNYPLWNHRTIAMHILNNTNQYTYDELMRYMRSRQFRFVNNM